MKALLHAAAVILLLLLFRPKCMLAAVCYKKTNMDHFKDGNIEDAPLPYINTCNQHLYYVPPKYKKDPEIDVDNEQIGEQPLL
ncbi:unnamed protein product, partial [Brenthis ino]